MNPECSVRRCTDFEADLFHTKDRLVLLSAVKANKYVLVGPSRVLEARSLLVGSDGIWVYLSLARPGRVGQSFEEATSLGSWYYLFHSDSRRDFGPSWSGGTPLGKSHFTSRARNDMVTLDSHVFARGRVYRNKQGERIETSLLAGQAPFLAPFLGSETLESGEMEEGLKGAD